MIRADPSGTDPPVTRTIVIPDAAGSRNTTECEPALQAPTSCEPIDRPSASKNSTRTSSRSDAAVRLSVVLDDAGFGQIERSVVIVVERADELSIIPAPASRMVCLLADTSFVTKVILPA